ncbi:MAG: DNA cytosine methyltransferase [Candidatus Omnitrophica bacterium]|nr:DNA cytosine methyltransferase [Candidatus Omnitrophota bacterium]
MRNKKYGFYEFFAGGGMARIGLGARWQCLFANDNSQKKSNSYVRNFPSSSEFVCQDIAVLGLEHLPGKPALSWASFPCQDLSLAGERNGLNANRSGTFWPFWNLMMEMGKKNRPVPIIVVENVVGAITSNQGKDFQALIESIVKEGYKVGPLVMDAVHFVPQSRPRLFLIAFKHSMNPPPHLMRDKPDDAWHPRSLQRSFRRLPTAMQDQWIWWNIPSPPERETVLSDILERNPPDVEWHSPPETQRLLDMMSERNREKVLAAQSQGTKMIGAMYRRTRRDKNGMNIQRAEVRFDQISGCLRTPAGGSSRQILLFVEGRRVRSRLLSSREAARLMGVPESYTLPDNYNEAYHLVGDGVVVPVVSWIEKKIIYPIVRKNRSLLEGS